MQKELYFNPFVYIAGGKSLVIGIAITLLVSFACYFSGTHFYSLKTVFFAKDMDFKYYLIEHVVFWLTISTMLAIMGVVLSKSKIRIIDVYGTQAISRAPLILLPLVRFIPVFASMAVNSVFLDILFWIHLFVIAWTVILMFNAYKVACNVKEFKLYGSFIVSLVFSEFLVKIIIETITH